MSAMCNEYIVASNNSINDNKYNAKIVAKSNGLRSVLKPLLKLLKQIKNKQRKEQRVEEQECSYECDQNSANEELESRIFQDIDSCDSGAAVWVYDHHNVEAVPVFRGQQYVPVHFARTEAGTFFWTTVSQPADCDFVHPSSCYTECQEPTFQSNFHDRWVQA